MTDGLAIDAGRRSQLARVGEQADADIEIGEAALLLAAATHNRDVSLEPYRRHLKKLIDDVAAYAGRRSGKMAERHEALVQVIHRRMGYAGTEDCFDDIEAADLMRVIDRRAGLPVAIGVLYLEVCRALDWPAAGVDFPGRFLLRLDGDDGRIMFDGFDGGAPIGPPELRLLLKAMAGAEAELAPEHYREAGPRTVLLRLQNNIKARLLEARKFDAALRILETMVLIAPAQAELWRERGLLLARLDRIPAAVAALEEFMRQSPSDQARYQTSALLQELRGRLG